MAYVEMSARVAEEDYREFESLLPIRGATTWFIRNALKELLASLREDDSIQERVRSAVEKMVAENREAA